MRKKDMKESDTKILFIGVGNAGARVVNKIKEMGVSDSEFISFSDERSGYNENGIMNYSFLKEGRVVPGAYDIEGYDENPTDLLTGACPFAPHQLEMRADAIRDIIRRHLDIKDE